MVLWVLRCLVVAAVVLPGLAWTVAPAAAHPFGDPQVLELGLDDEKTVRVRWRVGMTDDLSWLALHLGLLPEERVLLDGALGYEAADADRLSGSEVFDAYLLDRITVASDGRACDGRVVTKEDLATDGATLAYTCGAPVRVARVDAPMLTDLHPAYRTMATGPRGQRFVYDGDNASQEWVFAAGGGSGPQSPTDLGRSAAIQVGLVLAGLAAVGLLARLVRRRHEAPIP